MNIELKVWYIFFISLFLVHTTFIYASDVKELEKKKKTLTIEIEHSNRTVKENKQSLENVLRRLNTISQQIIKESYYINRTEKEITRLDLSIRVKEEEIKKFKKDFSFKKRNYAVAIQNMYHQKRQQDHWLLFLLVTNLTQSYHKMLYWKEFGKYQKRQGKEILDRENKVIAEKQSLQKNKEGKSCLIITQRKEEKQLQIQEKTKKVVMNNLKEHVKKLQLEIENKKKQTKALEKEIERTIQMDIANSIKKNQITSNNKRKVETKGGYAMTKEEQILSANFCLKKGQIPLPLKGNYCIIGRFGEQTYKGMGNIRYNSNGIDIKTTCNNTAKAVFDGVVSRIFILPGYQSSVILRHGNYLTLYSYVERLFVKQGDKVKIGQDIGTIYTDKERDNSTILHFELWKEQLKLDPEPWFYK